MHENGSSLTSEARTLGRGSAGTCRRRSAATGSAGLSLGGRTSNSPRTRGADMTISVEELAKVRQIIRQERRGVVLSRPFLSRAGAGTRPPWPGGER